MNSSITAPATGLRGGVPAGPETDLDADDAFCLEALRSLDCIGNGDADWSPNGSLIAFDTDRGNRQGFSAIYVMDPNVEA